MESRTDQTVFAVMQTLLLGGLLELSLACLPAAAAEQRRCQPLARVIASSSAMLVGQVVCVEDGVVAAQATVFCPATGLVQTVVPGRPLQEQGCPPVQTYGKPCGDEAVCDRPKGGTGANLSLRSPLGSVFLTTPQKFTWEPTPTATHYQVRVEGDRTAWEIVTTALSLDYPTSQLPLKSGIYYTLDITALNQGQVIETRRHSLNLLYPPIQQRIKDTAQQLRQLKLDPDATAVDLGYLYLAHGLLNDAVTLLSERVASGSKSGEVYKLLAESYARAGQKTLAVDAYQQGIRAAVLSGDLELQGRLEQSLRQLTASTQTQLPTRINGAQ